MTNEWKLTIKGGPGSGHHGHAGRPGQRGGSSPGKGSSRSAKVQLKYKPSPDSVRSAVEFFDDSIQSYVRYGARKGATAADLESEVFSKLQEDLDNPIAARRSTGSTVAILEEGRFKTQYEVGTSGGTYDPGRRAFAEYNGLGYPKHGVPFSERPVYGYVKTDNHMAAEYGQVEFIFKEEVKDRATITMGDSLYKFEGKAMAGSPYHAPGKEAIEGRAWDYLEKNVGDGVSVAYIETQIQGGVTFRDVAKIVVHQWPAFEIDDFQLGEIKRLASMRGIPVEVVEDDFK